MAFVYRYSSLCRMLWPVRSLSRPVGAGHRMYTNLSAVEQNTSIVKKKEGEGVVEYVAPDELVRIYYFIPLTHVVSIHYGLNR